MLTRALRCNVEVLRDAAKQLSIWSRNKKAEFCTYKENRYDYKRERKISRRYDDYFDEDFSSNRNKFSRNLPRKDFILRNKDIVIDEELKPIVKDFYKPHPNVLNRSVEEINEFRNKYDIQVFGRSKSKCPPPVLSFDELSLSDETLNIIRKLNYSDPTPVQSLTWPIALSGYNMVGISRTGSGKTLGFVLPALVHIQHQPELERGEGPIALIIAPTRELVRQIEDVVMPFARNLNLGVSTLYGGSNKSQQIRVLERLNQICIATPGRLNDILSGDFMNLNRCTYFVLDEADRLLDMGFHPQIKSVFHYCRPDRQVLMWSATWPQEVRSLAEDFLKDYIAVKFGSAELAANPNIKQIIHVCDPREKFKLLLSLLDEITETSDNKTLIFTATKIKAHHLGEVLKRHGYRVGTIHGDKSQAQRDQALKAFRDGTRKILIGTEVVGRGIDIEDIRYVINFDFPKSIESYVHNIGRTARNNSPGTAHSFFTEEDSRFASDLINILKQAKQPINSDLNRFLRRRDNRRRSDFDEWDVI